jgi:putative ABC transport system substrate-binding protein
MRLVGHLTSALPTPASDARMAAFRQAMRELGHVEGENLHIEERLAGGADRLAGPAAELVRLRPEVILVSNVPAARAARAATDTIPIVCAGISTDVDLVASGLVAGQARPGGNVTGLGTPVLFGKQLELLREVVPTLGRVAVLYDLTLPNFLRDQGEAHEAAASRLGLELWYVGTRGAEDLEAAFEAAVRERADGLFVAGGPVLGANQARVAELATRERLPSVWQQSDAAGRGGLMAYGPDRVHLYRQAAAYVDKILNGASPAELPVQHPTTFEFIINLKTAKALGLTIPEAVLQQATELIQ